MDICAKLNIQEIEVRVNKEYMERMASDRIAGPPMTLPMTSFDPMNKTDHAYDQRYQVYFERQSKWPTG